MITQPWARGGAFHLSLAERLLQVASSGSAGARPSAVLERAATHLDDARGDLAVVLADPDASRLVGLVTRRATTQAGSAAELLAAGRPGDAATTLRLAVADAWVAQRRLAAIDGDAEPLGRHLLAQGPLADRDAIRTADAARLARRAFPEPTAILERTLRSGAKVADGESIHTPTSWNGSVGRATFADPGNADPAAQVRAIVKGIDAQAVQEEVGWNAAKAGRIDHYEPVAQRRADGSIAIEELSGAPSWTTGTPFDSADDLDRLLVAEYRAMFPSLPEGEAWRAAVADREQLQGGDYVVTNSDRHRGNGFPQPVSFFDSGFVFRGENADPVVPRLRDRFQGREGRTELSEAGARELARNYDAGARARILAPLRTNPGPLADGPTNLLREDRSLDLAARMAQRVAHVEQHRGFDYVPLGEYDNPVAGWLS